MAKAKAATTAVARLNFILYNEVVSYSFAVARVIVPTYVILMLGFYKVTVVRGSGSDTSSERRDRC